MAVTIQTEPNNFNPVNNPCVFDFSSTQTGQANFSLLVELTVNGSVHSFHQVFPESANYAKFDASEILRTIVFSNIVTDGTFVGLYSNAVVTYSIRVREKYGTPPIEQGSWTSASTTLTNVGNIHAIKHSKSTLYATTQITPSKMCNSE